MEQIRFSIIIPSYNVEEYIEKTLSSVYEQSYKNFEVVIVDDGSTDNTINIIKKFNYDNLKLFEQDHLGVSAARNRALKEASGEYIVFLDSDDWLDDWILDDLNEKINSNDKDTVYIGMFNTYKEEDEERNCVSEVLDREMINGKTQGEVLEYLYRKRLIYTVWRFVISRKMIVDNELFFLENYIHEDEEWVPRMLAKAKNFMLIEKPFYNYRIRKRSIMSTNNEYRQKCLIDISRRLLDFAEKEENEDIKLLYKRNAYRILFQSYLNVRNDAKPLEPYPEKQNKVLKNIIIHGCSRAGKTTLSLMLAQKLKYNLICEDNIVSGFEKGMPELEINHSDREGNSVRNIEPFLVGYIKSLNGINQKLRGINYVIEGSYLSIEKLKDYKKDFVVIGLVFDFSSPKEFFDNMRKYDQDYDWTKNLSDDELYKYAENLYNYNSYIKEKYDEYGIKYYIVSDNRDALFNEISHNVEKLIRM